MTRGAPRRGDKPRTSRAGFPDKLGSHPPSYRGSRMSRMIRASIRASLLSILLAGAAGAPHALAAPAAVDLRAQVPVGPQVKVGKLPNGLTYYIQKNGKPANRVELR